MNNRSNRASLTFKDGDCGEFAQFFSLLTPVAKVRLDVLVT